MWLKNGDFNEEAIVSRSGPKRACWSLVRTFGRFGGGARTDGGPDFSTDGGPPCPAEPCWPTLPGCGPTEPPCCGPTLPGPPPPGAPAMEAGPVVGGATEPGWEGPLPPVGVGTLPIEGRLLGGFVVESAGGTDGGPALDVGGPDC